MQKPDSCAGCVLQPRYNCGSFINPEGHGALGVLIVGEAAGANEAIDELPFRPQGDSGSVLERCWARLGLARDQFRITNALRCRPPNNKLEGERYEVAAIEHCRRYLDQEIREFKPRAILTLGGVATRTVTGLSGKRQGIQSIRGFPLRARDYDIPVIPSLHPAFLRRGKMSWMGLLIRDIQYAVQVARDGAPVANPGNYVERATVHELAQFRDWLVSNPGCLLAYDIETDYSLAVDENDAVGDGSNIILVQFSASPGTGMAVPFEPKYVGLIAEILALPNPKVAHNGWMFDGPLLAAHGCPVKGDVIHDSMWAWHHLQPELPRNLQSVVSLTCPEFGPWKHESGMDLNRYGCKDVDVLQRIWPKIEAELRAKDLWRGYERHVRRLWPVLERMSKHGIPIDAGAQSQFKAFMEVEIAAIDGRLQTAFPQVLKDVNPKQGFAKVPKRALDAGAWYDQIQADRALITQLEYAGYLTRDQFIAREENLIQRTFTVPFKRKVPCHCVSPDGELFKLVPKCPACKGRGLIKIVDGEVQELRWARLLPFKTSQKQIVRYIKAKGHKVPKAIGQDKDSVAKLFVDRLAKETKDPFYKDLLEHGGYKKMLGTYMWEAAQDGCVHPKFTFSPATGQLAATDPPCMTIPAPKGTTIKDRLAIGFRKTLAARPGHVFMAVDYSGFHTSTFAFEAKDPDYFRLANTIGDPHSFVTAVMLGRATPDEMLAMPDDELVAYFEKIKKENKPLRDGFKPAILGFALGLGANKLYEQNRYDPDTKAGFKAKREAEALVQRLRELFSKCYQYQKDIRLQAHTQGYLKNAHGFWMVFWDVLHNDPRTGQAVPGDQAEAAIAFNVQADAHGHLKDAVLRMEAQGWLERYGLCNIIHDEVFFEVELGRIEEALHNVVAEMQKPSEVLIDPVLCPGGLVVKAEASLGWNRGEMMSPGKFLAGLARGN